MVKKLKTNNTEVVFYPTEWARQMNIDDVLYVYHDKKLGRITQEKFGGIKL